MRTIAESMEAKSTLTVTQINAQVPLKRRRSTWPAPEPTRKGAAVAVAAEAAAGRVWMQSRRKPLATSDVMIGMHQHRREANVKIPNSHSQGHIPRTMQHATATAHQKNNQCIHGNRATAAAQVDHTSATNQARQTIGWVEHSMWRRRQTRRVRTIRKTRTTKAKMIRAKTETRRTKSTC